MNTKPDVPGPLSLWRLQFIESLESSGYSPLTIREHLRVMTQLGNWLSSEGLEADGLTSEVVDRFLADRRAGGARTYVTVRGLEPLLCLLRSVGAAPEVPTEVPATPAELLVDRYRIFLVNERGLAPRSVMQCTQVAEKLTKTIAVATDELKLEQLDVRSVRAFINFETAGLAPASAQHVSWSLRSFLKFLFVEGVIEMSLAEAVPNRRVFAQASLPNPLTSAETTALTESCDATTSTGLRMRAAVMLMARLGLRAGEVTRLTLDDLDWRTGEVVVAGKGGRVDRLPMPTDVGAAVADYLRDGRPARATTRAVFVAVKAPHGPLTSPTAMNSIIGSAASRAGLDGVTPHRLRHAAASQMLAGGASLSEIGQVLRHRDEATTAIYAKVDHRRLSVLARPWPGVTR